MSGASECESVQDLDGALTPQKPPHTAVVRVSSVVGYPSDGGCDFSVGTPLEEARVQRSDLEGESPRLLNERDEDALLAHGNVEILVSQFAGRNSVH